MSKNLNVVSTTFIPFVIVFPLAVIAFNGCFKGGCQGALNAQSKAIHQAYVEGGWDNK